MIKVTHILKNKNKVQSSFVFNGNTFAQVNTIGGLTTLESIKTMAFLSYLLYLYPSISGQELFKMKEKHKDDMSHTVQKLIKKKI